MNQMTVAGHLGADPEVRFTSSGRKVTSLRVAARVRKGGKDDTIWWRVSVWGEQYDKMISYLKKGHPVVVMGELDKPEIFTDREGKPQVSMNITAQHLMFSPFGRPDGQAPAAGEGSTTSAHSSTADVFQGMTMGSSQGQGKMEAQFSDDEIPF